MLINKLLQIAKRIGVTVKFIRMEEGGCYLPEYDVIFIREDLPDHEKLYALAHELTHAIKHKEYSKNYVSSAVNHSKMEYEAELDAIKTVIDHFYSHGDWELEQLNYIRLMDYYEIDYSFESVVKEMLTEYFLNTKRVI